MKNSDQIQGFLFENLNIRGQLVHLSESFLQAIKLHDYPVSVQHLVGEFMAAAALLGSAVKFPGTLSIQAQGTGDLSLVLAECSSQNSLRAIARWKGLCEEEGLAELLGAGQLSIIMATDKGPRYQGVVPLERPQFSQCLEDYFNKSEQIPTRIWLNTKSQSGASGLLLQKMPGSDLDDIDGSEMENWNRICQLTDTLTHEELQQLDNEQLLFRLYHEETVRVFTPEPLIFQCSCSRERTLESLASLGKDELDSLFEKEEFAHVKCQFCNREYNLSYEDLQPHLQEPDVTRTTEKPNPNRTLH